MADDFARFIEDKVLPQYRSIVVEFRKLMKRIAPEATERMRGGTAAYIAVPVYRVNRDVIAISPSKAGVTLSFSGGQQFDDPYGLLGGAGKASRTVRLRSLDEFNEAALTHYIRQAVDLDLA